MVSFVAPPEINFDLGGVANLLDFPGLVEVAKSAAMESLSTMVVVPSGIVVPMVEQDSDTKEQVNSDSSYNMSNIIIFIVLDLRMRMPASRTCSC